MPQQIDIAKVESKYEWLWKLTTLISVVILVIIILSGKFEYNPQWFYLVIGGLVGLFLILRAMKEQTADAYKLAKRIAEKMARTKGMHLNPKDIEAKTISPKECFIWFKSHGITFRVYEGQILDTAYATLSQVWKEFENSRLLEMFSQRIRLEQELSKRGLVLPDKVTPEDEE